MFQAIIVLVRRVLEKTLNAALLCAVDVRQLADRIRGLLPRGRYSVRPRIYDAKWATGVGARSIGSWLETVAPAGLVGRRAKGSASPSTEGPRFTRGSWTGGTTGRSLPMALPEFVSQGRQRQFTAVTAREAPSALGKQKSPDLRLRDRSRNRRTSPGDLQRAHPPPRLVEETSSEHEWCGRPGSNRHGQSPTDFRTTSTFAAAHRRSWSGLSLRHSPKALDAARLVSTPSRPETGLARDRHLTGFPDFERFYVRDFPRRTQSSA